MIDNQVDQLAAALIVDIQVSDMNFVERVLMPLLNFESKVDLAIHVWDA